jgi:hypothetical protein
MPKSFSHWLMKPACRLSSRAISDISSLMSGLVTRFFISV